ncbi:hypothetical protein SAMN05216358_0521 [Rhizobium sp. AN5]|uniref:hypothetical protein n=1 Tax=Rhizobium sp. AN5 TaxID=1855304 RepID=UPI000BCB21BC|nr:hypothetical protein [Rhizobium sp. AN5]SOC90453.1 hypothetical protein SAMN05216358_0521 [Rhizobium sp. AN5]
MTFCARLRFKILSRLNLKEGSDISLSLPAFSNLSFEMNGEAHPFGYWMTALSRGHESEAKARVAGERLADALMMIGAVDKLGLDLGFSKPTLGFGAMLSDKVRKATGKELRAETHGLMVYEEGSVQILNFEARAEVLTDPASFKGNLSTWADLTSSVNERQRHCAALLNDSFYAGRVEPQFILRISAVEALCGQDVRDEQYDGAVTALERHLAGLTIDEGLRETLARTLNNARRQSVRQAYLAKFRTLELAAEGTRFDALYQLRSKLVHEGQGRGELQEATNDALEIATMLLSADIRATKAIFG